jgi:hypothetical protein
VLVYSVIDCFSSTHHTVGGDMKEAAAAAMQGMARTAQMQSQAGRFSCVAAERIRGTPDPGAFAVAAAFVVVADQGRQ